MTLDARQIAAVKLAIETLVANGTSTFKPGDVASHQRELSNPIPVWELRAIFSALQDEGYLTLNSKAANWSLAQPGESVAAS